MKRLIMLALVLVFALGASAQIDLRDSYISRHFDTWDQAAAYILALDTARRETVIATSDAERGYPVLVAHRAGAGDQDEFPYATATYFPTRASLVWASKWLTFWSDWHEWPDVFEAPPLLLATGRSDRPYIHVSLTVAPPRSRAVRH